jgi:hypothetical protein
MPGQQGVVSATHTLGARMSISAIGLDDSCNRIN